MTKRKKRPDCPWVVCVADNPHVAAKCLRCGEELRLGFPVAVNVLVAAGNAFTENHRYCEETRPESSKSAIK